MRREEGSAACFASRVPTRTYSPWLGLALLRGRDGRAAEPEQAEIVISDESERELYLLALERHDALGKPPDHICREAFVQMALEHGLQARGGGVVLSSRSMKTAVNKQAQPQPRPCP